VSEALAILLRTHEQIRANLLREEAAINGQLVELQAAMHALQKSRQTLEQRRWALDETERAYRDVESDLAPATSVMLDRGSPSDANRERKLRARVGPQRYLILEALRDLGPMSIDETVSITGLSLKRVKDQVNADVPLGVIAREGTTISITDDGRDLMARFEDYKKSKGEPLPSRDTVASTANALEVHDHGGEDGQTLEAFRE
jgi:hypothetical protein